MSDTHTEEGYYVMRNGKRYGPYPHHIMVKGYINKNLEKKIKSRSLLTGDSESKIVNDALKKFFAE